MSKLNLILLFLIPAILLIGCNQREQQSVAVQTENVSLEESHQTESQEKAGKALFNFEKAKYSFERYKY